MWRKSFVFSTFFSFFGKRGNILGGGIKKKLRCKNATEQHEKHKNTPICRNYGMTNSTIYHVFNA
jgi:hypothetical protein